MRRLVDRGRLLDLMARLGQEARGPGKIYFTGGATMMLWGLRDQTIDVDMRLDPEPPGVFESIARVKNELDLNIELASPADFLPAPPDWRERSLLIERIGDIEFYHYDPRMQFLAKLERGHQQDFEDCRAMLKRGIVDTNDLRDVFQQIKPSLIRFPAVAADELESKLTRFLVDPETNDNSMG